MKAIVPLDGSDNAQRIFVSVRRLLAIQPDLEVHLVTVLDPKSVHGRSDHLVNEPPSVAVGKTAISAPLPRVVESHGEALERHTSEAREWLEAVAAKETPGANATVHATLSGHAAEAIVALAEELDADLIAMAAHGRSGLSHLLTGSITEAVVRTSKRPVLVQGPAAG